MNKERLLNVAKALRESPDPTAFTMGVYGYDCGTPACAFGHYAVRPDLQDVFRLSKCGYLMARDSEDSRRNWLLVDTALVLDHFGITREQTNELFSGRVLEDEEGNEVGYVGCGNAQTAIEAAEYIEDFVARGGL